jgi:hypothetical protein
MPSFRELWEPRHVPQSTAHAGRDGPVAWALDGESPLTRWEGKCARGWVSR